jgi:L-alanine-DL-glutamate epimerase-like enolase superfamily enzyme
MLENPDVFAHEEGTLAAPEQPGLGVEIDQSVLEAAE